MSDTAAKSSHAQERIDSSIKEKKLKRKPTANSKKMAETEVEENSVKIAENKEEGESSKEKKTVKKKNAKRPFEQPKIIEMITEALENLNDSKGSSVQAIKSYILLNYKVRDDLIKIYMKKALIKAIDSELVVRPKGQAESKQILCGRYMICQNTQNKLSKSEPRSRPPSLRPLTKEKSAAPKRKSKKNKRKRRFF